ncbi:type II toxin-antitoxin system PemK/MazF family toxin [Brevibacillus laterosporus]|uniref:type II toxin-antitoxin system PemK/MazF family toxin n=1 Tax=Brevibacillus laterosporus TaxID=1465 RepID=UPI000839C0A0|nr:type II toxin-antitoxin system PemK/MazF family toxin [Brevibacillus laterosporus]
MNADFSDKRNWRNIERGFLFEAAMIYPSDMERPLLFFIPDGTSPNHGKLVKSLGDFRPQKTTEGYVALEQKIVMNVKPRRVLILSDNTLNKSEEFEFVQIAPVMSISRRDQSKAWYQKTIEDDHPAFIYLPREITGKECYVDVSEIMSIHKSLLLMKKNKVPNGRMQVVEDAIIECLGLGLIPETDATTISSEYYE